VVATIAVTASFIDITTTDFALVVYAAFTLVRITTFALTTFLAYRAGMTCSFVTAFFCFFVINRFIVTTSVCCRIVALAVTAAFGVIAVAIFALVVCAAFTILLVTTATVAALPIFYRFGTRMARSVVTTLRSCCIVAITRILATARLAAGATPLTLLCLIIPVITRVTWRMGAGGRNC